MKTGRSRTDKIKPVQEFVVLKFLGFLISPMYDSDIVQAFHLQEKSLAGNTYNIKVLSHLFTVFSGLCIFTDVGFNRV